MAMISRLISITACRTYHGNKRYLDAVAFHQLSTGEAKVEAYLWMIWPRACRFRELSRICTLTGGGALTHLVAAGRIVRIPHPVNKYRYACYRFKPT